MKSVRTDFRHTMKACYLGYIGSAAVNNYASLLFLTFQATFGISLEKISLLVTLNFGVQLLVDLLSAKFVDQIGYRVSAVAAQIFSTAGMLGLATLPFLFPNAYIGLATATVLYAIGSGLNEVLISPIIEACPTDQKSASMSLLHSFYCWGHVFVVAASTLFFTVFGVENWRILTVIWALIPLVDAFYFALVPIARLNDGESQQPVKRLLSTRLFWAFAVVMVCSGAAEQAMGQWASAFAEAGLKVSKTIGDLAGPCLFAVCMGVMRVFYAKFSEKVNLTHFMIGCGFLSICGYLLASLSPIPALALAGCACCGIAAGIMWPGTLSLAAASCPGGGTAMFALLALAGDLGCSTGPTLVGTIADAAGGNLKSGLTAAIIFPMLLCVGLFLIRRWCRTKPAK